MEDLIDILYESYMDWTEKCEPEQVETFEEYLKGLFEEIITKNKFSHETKNIQKAVQKP